MQRIKLWGTALVAGLLIETGVAWTADVAETRDVLVRLHDVNQKEIAMGRLAQKRARSAEAKSLAATIVDHHTALDEMVLALAREQHITLDTQAVAARAADTELLDLTWDPTFDTRFARAAMEEDVRAISAVTAAHDASHDARLRKLIEDALPLLRGDRELAQKILNAAPRALL